MRLFNTISLVIREKSIIFAVSKQNITSQCAKLQTFRLITKKNQRIFTPLLKKTSKLRPMPMQLPFNPMEVFCCCVKKNHLDRELCSSANMCCFENMVTDDDLLRIQEMFVTMFILSYHGRIPSHVILDCDDTNMDTYGCQEQSLFNGYSMTTTAICR